LELSVTGASFGRGGPLVSFVAREQASLTFDIRDNTGGAVQGDAVFLQIGPSAASSVDGIGSVVDNTFGSLGDVADPADDVAAGKRGVVIAFARQCEGTVEVSGNAISKTSEEAILLSAGAENSGSSGLHATVHDNDFFSVASSAGYYAVAV